MALNLLLPDGTPAFRTEIGLSTLDIATLEMRIEVAGFDQDGNKMVTEHITHQIDQMREVTREEIESVVAAHFAIRTEE